MKVGKNWQARLSSVLLLALLALSFSGNATAQIPQIPIPIPHKNPLGSAINLKGEEPVSTSFKDAKNEVVLPDSFSPKTVKSLLSLPIGPGGGFLLQPGAYEATVQSFCLHAGTHGPSKGDGYLYAPLKGSKAAVIRSLLRGIGKHSEIPQHNVQSLIWAIEARAKLNELSPDLQQTAFALLTKKEISDMNGGALGLVPDAVLNRALGAVPPEARRIFELQAELRRKLADPSASFPEIERIAVLAGPAAQDGPVVPRGRWSAHPGGFFVRYLPNGYSQTKLIVYVPETRQTGSIVPSRLEPVQYSFLKSTGMSVSPAGADAGEYDMSGDAAVPANTGAQRLGLAPPQPEKPPRKPTPTPTPTCGDNCRPAPACKQKGRCVKGVCKFDNSPKCSECSVGGKVGQCDGNGSCVAFRPGPPPKGTIKIYRPQVCEEVNTIAITKEIIFDAANVKDQDVAVEGCSPKLDEISKLHWIFSDGSPHEDTGSSVIWKAPDTPALVTVTLEGDDDGLLADDGPLMQLDSTTINVVVPDKDITKPLGDDHCPSDHPFGTLKVYGGQVSYKGCVVDFSGLTITESSAVFGNDRCTLLPGMHIGGSMVIGANNTYPRDPGHDLTDETGKCSKKDDTFKVDCVAEFRTKWQIGPANVPFAIHYYRWRIFRGDRTTNPPGGYTKMEISRTP